MKITAVLLAGGSGSRMGAGVNKVLLPVGGISCIRRSALALSPFADEMILVCRAEDEKVLRQEMAGLSVRFVTGGETRQASVLNGLRAMAPDTEIAMIHDGARCLVDADTICRCLYAAEETGSGIASVPVTDTVRKLVDGVPVGIVDRSALSAMQTPQCFRAKDILADYERAVLDGFSATDDASLAEHAGRKITLVEGNRNNLKLTTREDLKMAEAMMETKLRVGQGYDVHRLVEDRKLILCGVEVPHTLGLLGHSDADVALHALMDAMLGAAALGDIGKHFPDNDNRYLGISSLKLLAETVRLLREKHARVVNADVTIVAQKPKLLPYIPEMRRNVANTLSLPEDAVNVKATTTEHLGFEGEEKGISAQAVVMIAME